jgi:hypothetical protein
MMPTRIPGSLPCRQALAWLALLLPACSAGKLDVVGLKPNTLALGLVAHWPCDAEGGSALVDSSGNGHDGALSGVTWVGGQFGGALHFDAAGAVTVPSFPQAQSNFSVALWYRAPVGDYGDAHLPLVGNQSGNAGGWEMSVTLSPADNQYRFGYPMGGDGGGAHEHINSTSVDVDTWVHLAAVVDSHAMRLSFYKNGELLGESALSYLIQPGADALAFGWEATSRRYLVGDLDDVVIWNRALVQAELRELCAQPAPDPR